MTPAYPSANLDSGPSTEIGLDVQHASPPTQAYVGKDDSLWVLAASPNNGLVVTINFRLLMPDGVIKLNQQTLRFAASRSGVYQQINLPESFMLSVSATSNTSQGSPGGVFVSISLSRGSPSLFNAAQVLCEGYTYANQPVSWPTGVNSTSVDCAGVITTAGTSAPGAGNNFSITVPSNTKWRPISLFFTLTASATVANRFVTVAYDDGLNILGVAGNQVAITAAAVAQVTVNSDPVSQIPALFQITLALFNTTLLFPGYRIRSVVSGLQAGDVISAVSLSVEEWLLP